MTRNNEFHGVGYFLLTRLGTKARTRNGQTKSLELELHTFTAWTSSKTTTTKTDDRTGHIRLKGKGSYASVQVFPH